MSLSYDELTLGPDAYSPGCTRATPLAWTRVYRRRGREAHLRELTAFTGCGGPRFSRDWDGWLGTGCQEEYEHAAALPLCRRCFAYREHRLDDERLGTGHGKEMT
jgi:hypothetical protein